jgi:hypothetical protein
MFIASDSKRSGFLFEKVHFGEKEENHMLFQWREEEQTPSEELIPWEVT